MGGRGRAASAALTCRRIRHTALPQAHLYETRVRPAIQATGVANTDCICEISGRLFTPYGRSPRACPRHGTDGGGRAVKPLLTYTVEARGAAGRRANFPDLFCRRKYDSHPPTHPPPSKYGLHLRNLRPTLHTLRPVATGVPQTWHRWWRAVKPLLTYTVEARGAVGRGAAKAMEVMDAATEAVRAAEAMVGVQSKTIP